MKSRNAIRELRNRKGESQQIFATNLGISIRALVNYEKQKDARTPPLEVMLKMSNFAETAGYVDLARAFGDLIMSQLTEAIGDLQLNFLCASVQNSQDIKGLLFLTLRRREDHKAAANFIYALNRARSKDEETRKRGERIIAALNNAAAEDRERNKASGRPEGKVV